MQSLASRYRKFKIQCPTRICQIILKSQDESLLPPLIEFLPARLMLLNDSQNPQVQASSLVGFPDDRKLKAKNYATLKKHN